jgi:Family of unknown function (DUF5946)
VEEEICPGCGLALQPFDGPTHPYIGASPSCWALYGEILAREFSDVRRGRIHGTTVDAYAVQHPGVPERRSIRSVGLHLVRLCLVLERNVDQTKGTKLMARLARGHHDFEWLDPPKPNGTVTVKDVASVAEPEKHVQVILQWAADVWASWAPHHDRVRQWLQTGLE